MRIVANCSWTSAGMTGTVTCDPSLVCNYMVATSGSTHGPTPTVLRDALLHSQWVLKLVLSLRWVLSKASHFACGVDGSAPWLRATSGDKIVL